MADCLCLVKNPFSWLAALGCLLVCSPSLGFGFLTIFLTSSVLILCPVFLCRLRLNEHKSTRRLLSCTRSTDEVLSESSHQQKVYPVNDSLEEEEEEEEEAKSKVNETLQENVVGKLEQEEELKEKRQQNENHNRSSEILLSDSESVDHTTTSSEDSENDSMFRENLSHSTNYSDGSISDEESLIEIALPTGQYVDSNATHEASWYGFQHQKWPDCSLKSHFRQQNWMEMLNEMNEENFIEIDLCMGSIKCSRFEIQA